MEGYRAQCHSIGMSCVDMNLAIFIDEVCLRRWALSNSASANVRVLFCVLKLNLDLTLLTPRQVSPPRSGRILGLPSRPSGNR